MVNHPRDGGCVHPGRVEMGRYLIRLANQPQESGPSDRYAAGRLSILFTAYTVEVTMM